MGEGNEEWGQAEAEGANRLVERLDTGVYWTNAARLNAAVLDGRRVTRCCENLLFVTSIDDLLNFGVVDNDTGRRWTETWSSKGGWGGGTTLVPRGWIPVYIGLICAIRHGGDGSIEGWLVGLQFQSLHNAS